MVVEEIKIQAAIQEALSFLAKLDGSKDDRLVMGVVQGNLEKALYFVNKALNT